MKLLLIPVAIVLLAAGGAGIYSVTADEDSREEVHGSACDEYPDLMLGWTADGASDAEIAALQEHLSPEFCAQLAACKQANDPSACPRPLDY